jgi:nucleotide-binding universal stress UspA family protein
MKTILVPIDFSALTSRVIAQAEALARLLAGRIILLHVTEPVAKVVDYAVIVVSVAQVNEAASKEAKRKLSEFEAELRTAGLTVESSEVIGSPASEIVAQALKHSADYIIIGSHGHTAFYDLLVGGTASGVLKRSECPVVIVPPAPGEKDAG